MKAFATLWLERELDNLARAPLVSLLRDERLRVGQGAIDVLPDDLGLVMATARRLRRLGLDVVEVSFTAA